MYCIVLKFFLTLHRHSERDISLSPLCPPKQKQEKQKQEKQKQEKKSARKAKAPKRQQVQLLSPWAQPSVRSIQKHPLKQNLMETKPLFLTLLMMLHGGFAFAQAASEPDSIAGGYYNLDDVVITADKPIVQTDGATLTYNLDEDPSAKGNTLIDALRKVPMVSVDGDNNIRINGQDNFKIYVNGKEDPSLSANYKNIFRAMPAESVAKIEVITEPGAKYDAEGTAGILNLITISKNNTDGYSGSLTASLSKVTSGASAYGRFKKGKLSMSANVDYANGSLFPQVNNNTISTENFNSEDARFQKSFIHQEIKFNYIGGGVNLSYDLSDKDLITANGNVYNVVGNLNNCFAETSFYNKERVLTTYLLRDAAAQLNNTGVTASASWQHDWDSKGQKTILSYLYNHGANSLWVDLFLKQQSSNSFYSPFERQDSREFSNEHTVQFDYINPFSENHTLEAGAKAVIRRNDASAFIFYGSDKADATEDLQQRSDLQQKQDVYAAYASYTGKFGNLSTTAGLRFEHTRMGIDFKWGDENDFLHHMNDLVPNAALTYSFSMMSNLRLAYQMRISRPSVSQINPYQRIIFPCFVETGNPDLSSEKANKVSLTYTNFATVIGGNVGVEYSAVDNAIARYDYTIGDVAYSSYANIGHNRNLALFGFLNWSIIPRMQLSVNARLSRQMFSSRQPDYSNAGWSLNYGANWNYSIPAGFKFNAYVGQTTRSYNLQGHSNGWYYYGLGVSKSFLKEDALTLTLNANNFLQSHMIYKDFSVTDEMRTSSRFTNNNWNVGLSLSWNFGKLKSDVKKTAASINNDDTSNVSGKSQGSL